MENNTANQPPTKPLLTTHRLLALHQQLPFCCIVSESTLAYVAGCSFVIENIRTLQQEILWVGQSYHEIVKIEKNVCNYGPIKIGLFLRNLGDRVMEIVMFVVDWNNYFYRKRNQRVVRLPDLPDPHNAIIKFDSMGEHLCLFTQQFNKNYLTIYPTSTLFPLPKLKLDNKPLLISSFKQRNQSYFCLFYEKQVQVLDKLGDLVAVDCSLYEQQIEGEGKQGEEEKEGKEGKEGLGKKGKGLDAGEHVLQVQFVESCVGEGLGFVLGGFGTLVIFRVVACKFQDLCRIDMRMCKQTGKVLTQPLPDPLPQTISPSCFNISNNRILLCYPNTRNLLYITFSLLNYTNYSIHYSQNLLYLPFQKQKPQDTASPTHSPPHTLTHPNTNTLSHPNINMNPNPTCHSHRHKSQPNMTVQLISVSHDLCSAGLMVYSEGYRYLMVVDMLGLLVSADRVGGERVGEKVGDRDRSGGSRVFGNFMCRGLCRSVGYLEREGGLLVLHQDNKQQSYLSYYIFPYLPQISHKPPQQLLTWQYPLKTPANSLSAHPLNSTVLILYNELVRIHYYTHQKLSQNYININIPNCQCGSYSPYGDKVVLCTSAGIYVIDAYTMELRNFVVGWGGVVGKVPRGVCFVSDFDLVVQYGIGNNGYLLQLCNYSKIKMMGQLTTTTTKQPHSDTKPNLQPSPSSPSSPTPIYSPCLQIDQQRQLIISLLPNHQLKFYNINLQILNVLSIQPTCIVLNKEMELLFVGTARGQLYVFRWPDIVDKVSNIRDYDPEVVAVVRVLKDAIVSISISMNLRYLIVVSQSGQISYLQFLQQNSPNITRQGALQMLKKSTLKPYLQNCLTSSSDENKRTETIIKAVGKEVEVNKRNEKICEELTEYWEEKLEELNLKTMLMIKDEIDGSVEEAKIRNLLRQIEKMKEEIIEIRARTQTDAIALKQSSTQTLTQLYTHATTLQSTLSSTTNSHTQSLQSLHSLHQQQYLQQLQAQQIQYQIIENDTKLHKKMENKMQSYNQIELLRFQEERMEDLGMIQVGFRKELGELCQRRNQLQNSIRKYTVLIAEYNHKNIYTDMQLMQLKTDLQQISPSPQSHKKNQAEVWQKLQQIKQKNEQMIIEHRQLQATKQKSQKKAEFVENIHNQLVKDIQKLEASYEEIRNKKLELDDSFYQENRRRIQLNRSIGEVKDKILELKAKRDRIKQALVISNNQVSRSLHPSSSPTNTRPSSQHHTNTPSSTKPTLQQQLHARDCINEKLQKLNKVKNEKIRRYNLINKKLIDDHKRLTSQFNELKRYNDLLLKKQQKLKLQIKYGSLDLPTKDIKHKITAHKPQSQSQHHNKPQNNEKQNQNISTSSVMTIRKNSSLHRSGRFSPKVRKFGFVSMYQDVTVDFRDEDFDKVIE